MFINDAGRVGHVGVGAYGDDVFGHHVSHGNLAGQVVELLVLLGGLPGDEDLPDVPVGDDPDEAALGVHHREAAYAVLFHQVVGFLHIDFWRDGDHLGGHAVLS